MHEHAQHEGRSVAALGHKSVLWVAVAAALVLCASSLGVGFVGDDLPHRKFVLEHLHTENTPVAWWNMFDVCGRANRDDVPLRTWAGFLPWWTSRELKIAFLRPVAAASQHLDFVLFPDTPWLMHLHNVLLYGAIVWLAGLLYRRWLGAGVVSGLALVMYAVDEAHADATAWIAGRNTLLTALFVLSTLLLYDRARRDGSRAALLFALPSLLLAHGSSEGALAIWAYLVAYALCLDRGTLRARLLPLVPLACVTLIWFALSAAFGYGVHNSGLYVDPRSDPLLYLRVVSERLPIILRAQFALPIQLVRTWPAQAQHIAALASYAFLVLAAVVSAKLLWRRPTARFFAFGVLGSALPMCAGGAEPRLLFVVGLGAHGLVAESIVACLQRAPELPRARRALQQAVAGVWLVLHIPLAAVLAPLTPLTFTAFDAQVRAIAASLPHGRQFEGSAILVLNTNSYVMSMFTDMYRQRYGMPGPRVWHVLGTSETPVALSRPTRNAIALEPEGGYFLETSSLLVRSPKEGFTAGQVIELFGVHVVVERITPDGRPARVRFEFLDGEDPRLLWVTWNAKLGGYERVALPPIGHSLRLPASPQTISPP